MSEENEHLLIENFDDFYKYTEKEHLISDKYVDHTRWCVVHEIIFKENDKFWRFYYDEGATECQETEYNFPIKAVRVFPHTVEIVVYKSAQD